MSVMESSAPPDDQLFYRATPSVFGPPGPTNPTPSTLFGAHPHFAPPLDCCFLPHSPGSGTPSSHYTEPSPPTTILVTPISTAPPSTVDEDEFPTLKPSPHPHGRPSPLATTPSPPGGFGRGGTRSAPHRQNMAVKPSTLTQILNIVYEERRFKPSPSSQHLGEPQNTEQNRVCADIMQRTGAHLELQSNGDNSLTVLVQGKQKQVEDAKRLVSQQLQTQASTVIEIPKEYHVALLGKGGQTLRAIEEKSGARVSLPHRNENSNTIRVTGSKEAVAEACRQLQEIHAEQAKYATQRLTVEKEYLPFIKGPNGQLLAGLEEKARVRFVPVPNGDGSTIEIVVQGLREGVSQVVNVINSIYAEKKKSCTKFVYQIDRAKHRYIIGPRGSHIQEVLASTGVSIIMPPSDAPPDEADLITLFGPTRLHGNALTMVLDKANSMISETLDVPRWIHKHITKPSIDGAESLKDINTAFPKIHLEFKRDPDSIVIEGPPEDVQKVFIYLQGAIKAICQRVRILEIPVDSKLHPHIVGKGGIIINRIKDVSGVENIRVPGDKGPNYVQLEGSPDAIAIAHREILDIVDKKENEKSEEITMDHRYLPLIIGPNGEKIKVLRDRFNDLVISIPRRPPLAPSTATATAAKEGKKDRKDPALNHETGVVLLRGTKNDVDNCKRYLEEMKKSFAQFIFADFPLPDKFAKAHPASQNRYKRYLRDAHPNIDFKFPLGPPAPSSKRSPDALEAAAGAQSFSVRANDKETFEALKNHFPDSLVEIMMSGVGTDPSSPTLSPPEKAALVRKCDKEFGAQVRFPLPRDADQDVITIFGPKAGVEKAKNLIKQSLSDLNLRVTIECLVEPKYFPLILGAKGARINDLCQKHGVKIKMPTRSNATQNERASSDALDAPDASEEQQQQQAILITGKMEDCQRAREVILSGLPCAERLSVPSEIHGMIIGPRGRDIRQFNATYRVNLNLPTAAKASDVITITGNKGNVEKAKAALETLVEKLKLQLAEKELTSYSQEVEIDARHHGQLIGRRGEISAFCAEREVKVFFPNQGSKVRVVGNKEKVLEAVQALKERVEILDNTVRESFEISTFIVPKIIGSQGRNVRQLMTKYQVEINTPRSETATTRITITGPKDNVEQAKDYIQLVNLEHLQEVERRDDLKRSKAAPAPELRQIPNLPSREQAAPLVDTRYNSPLTADFETELNGNSDAEHDDDNVIFESQSDAFEHSSPERPAPASPSSVSSSAETRSPSVERLQNDHGIDAGEHDAIARAFDASAEGIDAPFRPESPLPDALSHSICNGFHPSTQMKEKVSSDYPVITNGYTNGDCKLDDDLLDGATGDHCDAVISDPEEPFLPPSTPGQHPPTELVLNGVDQSKTLYQQLVTSNGEKAHCNKAVANSNGGSNNGTCHHLEALEEEEEICTTPNPATLTAILNGTDGADGLIIV